MGSALGAREPLGHAVGHSRGGAADGLRSRGARSNGEAGPRPRVRFHVAVPREAPEPLSLHGAAVPGA
eukprot:2472083-Alexandrium_andersonii.AAC.1